MVVEEGQMNAISQTIGAKICPKSEEMRDNYHDAQNSKRNDARILRSSICIDIIPENGRQLITLL